MTDGSRILGPTAPVDLFELLRRVKDDASRAINCMQIGNIESYNSLKNTAVVSIKMTRLMADGTEISYPQLEDCPVFILGGGGAAITLPIAAGDTCLVLFNDRNIDNWWYDGRVMAPADSRAHSVSDGIVLVGVRNLAAAKLTPSGSVCIDGGTKKVAIKNGTTNLKTLIKSLIDAIKLITVTCAGPGSPSSVPLNVATFTALETQFATLLDEGVT